MRMFVVGLLKTHEHVVLVHRVLARSSYRVVVMHQAHIPEKQI